MLCSTLFRIPVSTSTLFCAKLLYRSAIIVFLVFPPAQISFGQETKSEDEVLRVETKLFAVPVRIRDKANQTAISLTERDLTLEDGDRITNGLYLRQGVDRLSLVFALDQSGSVRDIISQQRKAALGLFERFGENSKVAVLAFSQTARLSVPFGRESKLVNEAFTGAITPNQPTAIFDAAAAALKAFEDLPPVRFERRIVILISDGLDTASKTKPKDVFANAVRQHVSFYVIHLPLFEPRNGRLAVRSPSKGFKDLAEKTGGRYFLVGDPKSALSSQDIDLTKIFQAIEDDLRSQYLLGFYLAGAANDGRNHKISISLPPGFEYQIAGFKYARSHDFYSIQPKP